MKLVNLIKTLVNPFPASQQREKIRLSIMRPVILVIIAAFVSTSVVSGINTRSNAIKMLNLQMKDVLEIVDKQLVQIEQIKEITLSEIDKKNLDLASAIAELIVVNPSFLETQKMTALAKILNVDEIYVTDGNGVIRWGNIPQFFGLDFAKTEQTFPFLEILKDPTVKLAQAPMQRGGDGQMFQYVGVASKAKRGIVQIGTPIAVIEAIQKRMDVQKLINNIRLGKQGGILVLDNDKEVISGTEVDLIGTNLSSNEDVKRALKKGENSFDFNHEGETMMARCRQANDYAIIAYVPWSELNGYVIRPFIFTVFFGLIVSFLLLIVLYKFLTAIVVSPIEALSGDMVSLKKGARLSEEKYSNQNEFFLLCQSINEMLDHLQKSDESIIALRAAEEKLQKRLRQEEIISDLAQRFTTAEDIPSIIEDAITLTGTFLGVTRTETIFIDKETNVCYASHVWSSMDKMFYWWSDENLGNIVCESFPAKQSINKIVPILSINNILNEKKYQPLSEANIKSFIWAPIYLSEKLWGLLSIEECLQERTWTDDDLQFVSLIANLISGAKTKIQMVKDKTDALKEAQRASQIKTKFLANISHEIRTPMNAIIGMTKIAKLSANVNQKNECFDKIEDASTHLLGIINDILDISRIETNKFELFNKRFFFRGMIQKIETLISHQMNTKKQIFSISVDEKIPDYIITDEMRLMQVIMNLLSNAYKFTTENGRITLSAQLISEESDGKCVIQFTISDSGIGISPAEQKKLFIPFQQLDSDSSRKFGGTGLGLAIAKSILEQMGGRIWLESETGKGSDFYFTITVERGKPDEPSQSTEEFSMDDFSGFTILLAEDVEINREIVKALLEPTKVSIESAENGLEAVNMFTDNMQKYDLIFMDLQMPEMDGYEAARSIRAMDFDKAKNIPIVAMTANVLADDIKKCLEAGMNDHIGKPIDFDTVLAKLRQYLFKKH